MKETLRYLVFHLREIETRAGFCWERKWTKPKRQKVQLLRPEPEATVFVTREGNSRRC